MTSIIGYADLIRSEALEVEEQREAANFIVTEGKRLERLSQKLLQLQMLQDEDVEFSIAQPAALLEALAAEWKPVYINQDIALYCDGEDGACLLEPELVKTLLLNLWDNARKAGATRIATRSTMIADGCRTGHSTGGAFPFDRGVLSCRQIPLPRAWRCRAGAVALSGDRRTARRGDTL